MIKTVTVLHRRTDLTSEQFHDHWRDQHAPLVLAIPGVRRYVQGRPTALDQVPSTCDGIAEVWYDDEESMREAFATPEYAALIDDEKNFMASSTFEMEFVCVREDELSDRR
ncbi:EthD family reductase [Nocardioides cavernae]|uniref:EthD family reductase n=1 Tax=Nocardioides cavernae TaxID=1921566 RepID=A0ABR8N7Z1_9ACTN|nr:EthD domain-containing protein [Nocardioides cavernae]MBD3924252.1 EthD family reductase [Nocardioides cavernae]MBM7510809.1 uncharacterized protein (TIGR02118 family) [Nocardioides cavernae]